MAAPKDDGQMPPGGGRRAVIWRLPATREADDSAGAEAEVEADAPRSARASRGRRAPWPVVWGLVAALVGVGLYAAWSALGPDIWSTSAPPDGGSASSSASGSAPASATAPLAAEGAGDAPSGGDAPPPGADGARLAGTEEGAEAGTEAGSSGAAAPVAGAGAGAAPAVAAESAPAPVPADPPPASATSAGDGPRATAPAPVASTNGEDVVSAAPTQARNTVSADSGAGPGALDALAARLAALEARAAGTAGAGAGADAVAALERRVRSLEDDPAQGALALALGEWAEQRAVLETELATLGTRLAQVEADAAQRAAADGRLVALVLATGGLTAALGSSRPFTAALDTLRGVAGGDPEIADALARLAPLAATGAATLDGLRARYPQAANAVVRGASAGDDADWIDETVTRLSQLVTVRRTGGAIDPASLDGRLVAAAAALAAGDLGQAIAVFETLLPDGAGDGRAAEWLRDARARRAADAALAGLVDTLRMRVGARWAAGAAPP